MESYEYNTLFEFESDYWWFRGLRRTLLDEMRQVGLGVGSRILDAGCGTGGNIENISRRLTGEVYGFDVSPYAVPFWEKRQIGPMCIASINDMPYAANEFDAVVSVDVFECGSVDEARAYDELYRVVKPGGFVFLVVPAYDWLMSPEHHKAVGATRRYTRSRLATLLTTKPVRILRITHLFGLLLPAIAAYRWGLHLAGANSENAPKSDLKHISPLVNQVLLGITDIERMFLKIMNMPFGSSILAVVRKDGD